MSVIVGNTEYLAWAQTEDGLVKTAYGEVDNTDMAFAFVPIGQEMKSYVIIKTDPNKVAEDVEITADKNAITLKWWETDAVSKIPFRSVSTDGGHSWTESQNISILPDKPATIIPVGQ